MEFGVVYQTDPPAQRVIDLTVRAEQLGFSHAWTFDSHVLWQEPFVIFSRMLAETENMVVGPLVTNPATRDWTVIGSLFATLNDMYGDRTVCGIGRGDSAVRVIGRKPTTLATMAESMDVIKGLVTGREVDYKGHRVKIPWVEEPGWDLPVWVAGYGPRALDLVGRRADGYVLQLADPQILSWTRAAVRAAAEDEGRDPDEVTICVVAPAYVGDDLAHQRDQLRWFGGMVGNHVADLVNRYGTDSDTIPTVLTDYVRAREEYDYAHHGRAGNPTTDFVTDEIVDRFCLVGTASDHLAKVEELRSLGADHVSLYLMHDDVPGTLDAYGDQVIPAFR